MKKFYLLPLLALFVLQAIGQDCSSLAITYSVSESRCVATGSITVLTTGGSGNYTYKVSGPVTTANTSSNIITGLSTGYYSIIVKDIDNGCSIQKDSIFVPGSYSDPRFQLTKTDAGCAGNDGTISTINAQYGRTPFIYTIISPSPSAIGTTSATGTFTGLLPGEYSVQLQDSCGGIQVRRITIENYSWWFNAVSVIRNGCDSAGVSISLMDNKGNVNTSGTAFSGFSYGVVLTTGDTTWFSTNAFNIKLGTKRDLSIVVKDNCGNIHSTVWYIPDSVKPAIGSVAFSNYACTNVTATISGQQNLTNPQYCLFDASNTQVSCNTTGVFPNLNYGSYCIHVRDACYDTTITKCFTVNRPVPAVDASVAVSNKTCTDFSVTVTGQANLTSPQFYLIDELSDTLYTNTTGTFANVPYGNYCINMHDACTDTTITRCFSITKPQPFLTSATISGSSCANFNITTTGLNLSSPVYCLYDTVGNIVTCNSTGIFYGIPHGSYCIRAISCGDTTDPICISSGVPPPSVAATVQLSNKACTDFTATITGQTNLLTPQYYLVDTTGDTLSTNTTGIFNNIPYGSYCIKVHDACTDSTISRCFSLAKAIPSISATMQVSNQSCTTLTVKVTGTNLSSPQYVLYDSNDIEVDSNSTGIFNNVPYGSYCARVHDGCLDTVMSVCQTFNPIRGITLTTAKGCTINYTNITVKFTNASGPYTIKAYSPDGTLEDSITTATNPQVMSLPALSASGQYHITGIDNCGNIDSATITPDALLVTKTTTVRAKCPSSTWANGSGDVQASYTSNSYSMVPQIVNKDGSTFSMGYSSSSGTTFTFADLEPAQYIVKYTLQTCNTISYDTITVTPYAYPSQGQSATYQCDNNSFSLGAAVSGGVVPYSYQIIGSNPDSPSINTSPQTSPVFNINTGKTYSLVRLRSIDACGNATLNDVSILPLQNISIAASATCFYQNITLTADTIANASYTWYYKKTTTDSTLVDSGTVYNLPYFVPEQIGDYVVKVSVNDGCVTRLSTFTLDGNCGGGGTLATGVQLSGKLMNTGNQLTWSAKDDHDVTSYTIERKSALDANYTTIGSVSRNAAQNYIFNDSHPAHGNNFYRLQILSSGTIQYSNVINLKSEGSVIAIYPNPVTDLMNISFASDHASDFRVDIISASGQVVYTHALKNTANASLVYNRKGGVQPGVYLVRVADLITGKIEIRKVVFN